MKQFIHDPPADKQAEHLFLESDPIYDQSEIITCFQHSFQTFTEALTRCQSHNEKSSLENMHLSETNKETAFKKDNVNFAVNFSAKQSC